VSGLGALGWRRSSGGVLSHIELMSILPTNSQEWFTAFLRPFKVYTLLGVLVFQILLACRRLPGAGAMAELVLGLYAVSVLVFLFGALIQMICRQRQAGYITLLFAAADVVILFFLLPYFARA
jgi:hypothetical protein